MLRYLRDFFHRAKIARTHQEEELPNIVKSHSSLLLRKLAGVDMKLQENKVTNIRLACQKINGLIIQPGETFSFWRTLGPAGKKQGYQEGLVISNGKLLKGYGGGLCQMANMVHWLVLNSPLEVTELHHHTDAIFPDDRRRVPFGTGTSVFYNYIDYRFYNNTDQNVQLLVWVADGLLNGELRSERPFPCRYKLVESKAADFYALSGGMSGYVPREGLDLHERHGRGGHGGRGKPAGGNAGQAHGGPAGPAGERGERSGS